MRKVYDFDDTLNEFTEGFAVFMQRDVLKIPIVPVAYGRTYSLMDPFKEHTNISTIEALKLFETSGAMIELIKPTKAQEIIKTYKSKENTRRDILTARGWMDFPVQSVRDWFEHWFIPQPNGITVVGLDVDKSAILSEWKDVKEYYEDHPWHLQDTYNKLGHRIKVVAADRPHNRHIAAHDRM